MKFGLILLAAAALATSNAHGQQVRVHKGGPEITVSRGPEWQVVRLSTTDRIYRKSQREGLILVWSVLLRPGEHLFSRPWMATVDGEAHYLLPALIWDSGPGRWVTNLVTPPLLSSDWTAWDNGYLMVHAETGRVSDMPVVATTCDRCDFKDSGPIFHFKKPKESQGPEHVALRAFGSEEEAVANAQRAASELAERTLTQELETQRRRRSENPLKRQIGAEVCQHPVGENWQVAGYTEGVSPDNGKIQIRLVTGSASGQIIWDDPTNWELCSLKRVR